MKKQVIKLLQKQIDQLKDPEFDLEAWKSATEAILTKVFGASDGKIKQIHELKIDYSSWALRDSNAKYKPVETCKKKGQAILEAAIGELETFGLPVNEQPEFLAKFFTEEEQKILLSGSEDKSKIVSKLKKKDLEKLVLKFLKESIS
ncbi:MAG: hypothetical protein CMB80_07275 [Flammeovirgaceae bacterium]|nr:hypothetical protein [Flammeovirgaceae bacterium]HCX22367.1 hypothetical protein [Cytophagales bacterium]|tara:strand:+ start:1230 stop:1670 length:441 start_codon:yes stop_codon:yes gene_type:complete